jgi:tetratricopeptide (TPR) repeat protein
VRIARTYAPVDGEGLVTERDAPADQVSRLLIEKRCGVYTQVAALLMDLDEALGDDDAPRSRYLLQDVRRCLRTSLAFLTDEVYAELERLEALHDRLPTKDGAPISPEVARELEDRIQLLHVKLSRALTLPRLQPLEQIVSLPARLEQKLAEESQGLAVRARRRELEGQCLRFEHEARDELAKKNYSRAVKSLRQAIALDPERPVLRNDLGVVLSLAGRMDEAVEEYRAAVELNERLPARRTEEWATSYYNLGVALRKCAQDAIDRERDARAVERLRDARAAFAEYGRICAGGSKVLEARGAIVQIEEDLARLATTTDAAG